MKLRVRFKPGNKGKNDQVLVIYLEPNTLDGGEQIYVQDVLEKILVPLFENEDNIYPNGLGANYLLSAILDVRYKKGTIEEICRKHKLCYRKKSSCICTQMVIKNE